MKSVAAHADVSVHETAAFGDDTSGCTSGIFGCAGAEIGKRHGDESNVGNLVRPVNLSNGVAVVAALAPHNCDNNHDNT